jgi:hypothetical protein
MSGVGSGVVFIAHATGALAACSGGGNDAGPDAGDTKDPVLEILARPHVQDALAAAAAAGYPLTIETKPDPPPIAGYYVKQFGEGRFVASGNGANLTSAVAGEERRVDVHPDGTVSDASVGFYAGQTYGSGVATGLLLRGEGDNFTFYTTYHSACPIAGSNLVLDGVSIESGHFGAATGDLETVRHIAITVAATGTQSADCAEACAGDTEVAGGWIVGEIPRYEHITADELVYMCVDEDAGYVAGESWKEADGTACACDDYFEVACD